MKFCVIFLLLIIWIILFLVVFVGGSYLIDQNQKKELNRWGTKTHDYENDKWLFRFYVIAFFIGIPILVVVLLIKYINLKY